MDFRSTPALDELAAHAREVGRAAARRRDQCEDGWLIGYDPTFARELASLGWIGMTWPAESGGGGRSPLERAVVFEALIAEGAPLAAMYFADRQIGPTLLQFGTDEQRSRWLPDILSGRSMWCIGMSEPDAGSDVAGLRTRATRDPHDADLWRVNGAKIWTSGAAHADWCYLIARTDPDARPHEGLSEFVVDMHAPGITVTPIVDPTGNDHFCEVHFDDVEVPAANLIGTPNGSFRQVMRQMEHERGGIDRLVSNHRLYVDVLPLVERSDPVIRQELARIETAYRLGRLLVFREIVGQAPPAFSAATKVFCTEHEQRVAALAVRAIGAGSLAWESDGSARNMLRERVARNIVYSPAYTIMGGTTQILRNIIGERVLGLPRR